MSDCGLRVPAVSVWVAAAYPLGIHRIDLPEWAMAQWLERESVEADHKRAIGADILLAAMRLQAPFAQDHLS